jgi:hypothetical protein
MANMDVGPYQKIAAGNPVTSINRIEVHKIENTIMLLACCPKE